MHVEFVQVDLDLQKYKKCNPVFIMGYATYLLST
jgi:hypothetical protein